MNTTESLHTLTQDLRNLTEINEHGKSLELIARFFGYKQLEKAFAAVNTLHFTLGSLPEGLSATRNTLAGILMEQIGDKHGEKVRQTIYNCL